MKVLRLLAHSPEVSFTGREIARYVGVGPSNVLKALARLETLGVVQSSRKGASAVFQLNSRHVLNEVLLRDLFAKEHNLVERTLRGLPVDWERHARSVIVFGSVARGEATTESDVDLCIVARSKSDQRMLEDQIDGLRSEFYVRTGNPLSALILTAADFKDRFRKAKPLIRRIASEGRVLVGEAISELLT